jgi:hypothetical protein
MRGRYDVNHVLIARESDVVECNEVLFLMGIFTEGRVYAGSIQTKPCLYAIS